MPVFTDAVLTSVTGAVLAGKTRQARRLVRAVRASTGTLPPPSAAAGLRFEDDADDATDFLEAYFRRDVAGPPLPLEFRVDCRDGTVKGLRQPGSDTVPVCVIELFRSVYCAVADALRMGKLDVFATCFGDDDSLLRRAGVLQWAYDMGRVWSPEVVRGAWTHLAAGMNLRLVLKSRHKHLQAHDDHNDHDDHDDDHSPHTSFWVLVLTLLKLWRAGHKKPSRKPFVVCRPGVVYPSTATHVLEFLVEDPALKLSASEVEAVCSAAGPAGLAYVDDACCWRLVDT